MAIEILHLETLDGSAGRFIARGHWSADDFRAAVVAYLMQGWQRCEPEVIAARTENRKAYLAELEVIWEWCIHEDDPDVPGWQLWAPVKSTTPGCFPTTGTDWRDYDEDDEDDED